MQDLVTLNQTIWFLVRLAWILAVILLILAFAPAWGLAVTLNTTAPGNKNQDPFVEGRPFQANDLC